MKIIITGAAGFIGTHLVKYCLSQGHEVLAIDNKWTISHELLELKKTQLLICRNINVATEISYLITNFKKFEPEICYCLSAYASEGRSNHIRSFIHHNNTVGTANVINACVNHKCKLVFTSSVAVYSGLPPFSEQTNPNPIDEYGNSKYISERSIAIAIATQNLEAVVIRPRNVIGRGQNLFDPSRNLFGIWMYRALNNLPCHIYGDGSNKRSFTPVQNLIPALYKAKDSSSTDYNMGDTFVWSIEQVAELFKKVTGYNNFEYVTQRHEVKEAFCRNEKAEIMLGYREIMSVEECLVDMWAWAQTVPMRELDKMPELETHVNAHSSLK